MFHNAQTQKSAAILAAMLVVASGLSAGEPAPIPNASFSAFAAPRTSRAAGPGRDGRLRKATAEFSGVPEFATSRHDELGSPERKLAITEPPASAIDEAVDLGSTDEYAVGAEEPEMSSISLRTVTEDPTRRVTDFQGQIISPRPGSTLDGEQTFSWTPGSGADGYWLWVGSCQDCTDLYDGTTGRRTQETARIPNDGRRIYVTLFTLAYGAWWWVDYQYVAPNRTAQRAEMLTPTRASTLVPSQTFTWSRGVGVTEAWLWVGSCQDCIDILDESQGIRTTRAVSLPTDMRVIFVTLFSRINGNWYWIDYQYRAPGPGQTVTLQVTNRLGYAVNLSVNGRAVGSVPAGETRQTESSDASIALSWDLIRPTISGRALGDPMGGRFGNIERPSGRYTFTIDSRAGDQGYFAPMITNRTGAPLSIAVNGGLQAENRCNCDAPAYSNNIAPGYYRLYSNSNVRLYRSGSNYTGRYIYWSDFADRVEAFTGQIRLTATSLP